jgi:hypothetical protein
MLRTVVAAAAAFCLSSAAMAEPASTPPPAAAAAPSPAKLALAAKMVEVLRLKPRVAKMLDDFVPVMMEQQEQLHPELVPQRAAIKEVMDDVMRSYTDEFIQRYMPVYASTFTEEEMRSIIGFYSTPAGQALLDKTPQLSAASAELTREMLPDLQKEAVVKLCLKLNCLAPPPPEPPARQPS